MNIYRVEHKDTKDGPYQNPLVDRYMIEHTDFSLQPTPYDNLTMMRILCNESKRKKYKFGFTSLEQLISWFYIDNESINVLKENGFVISVYEIEEEIIDIGFMKEDNTYSVIQDDNQCMFYHTKAKIKDFLNL